MRLKQLQNNYLTEGLDRNHVRSILLWESAGIKLREANLTADQIQNIFAAVEKNADASGGNRTMLGKGKDAVDAVNNAWEDLKTKIQNSAPIKAVDQKYDDAVAKIEKGLGGPDNAVNQVIQKYRNFAKEHPMAQSFIYAALIAAAGISGAGLGGAAVLGLLKMTDKLLQGEKFSSAAYAGAKTGIMAFAASKLGDYLKDKWNTYANPGTEEYYVNGQQVDKATYERAVKEINQSMKDMKMDMNNFEPGEADKIASKVFSDDPTIDTMTKAQELRGALAGNTSFATDPNLNPVQQKLAAIIDSGKPLNQNQLDFLDKAIDKASIKANMLGDMPDGSANAGMRQFMSLQAMRNAAKVESRAVNGRRLSEGQVYMVFNRVANSQQINEGPLDAVKGAAGKAMDWAKTKGKNLTTRVTADKLNSAWKSAGEPMDSDDLYLVLTGVDGVSPDIVDKVYADLKIPNQKTSQAAAKPAAVQPVDIKTLKDMIAKLPKDRKARLMKYVEKQLKVA